MTPAEQYRKLANRLQAITEEWDGSRDGTPGINSDFYNQDNVIKPVWPPQATPAEKDADAMWQQLWSTASPEERSGWMGLVNTINQHYKIPSGIVLDWMKGYLERPEVQADPQLQKPGPAMYGFLTVQVECWLKDQKPQPLPVKPPRFDPRVHGGEVRPPMEKYFTRDIDQT